MKVLCAQIEQEKHISKKTDYVAPVQIYLGNSNGKEWFCQYVPVKESLSALFWQSTVRDQYTQSKHYVQADMVLNDVCDGKSAISNALICESPSAVSLILYQDSFEVTNPLGSGKQKTQNHGCLHDHSQNIAPQPVDCRPNTTCFTLQRGRF